MDYGIQLYSVRDGVERDYHETLRAVAALGYGQVELFGGMGPGAQTLKGWLSECGLTAFGTHTGADALAPQRLAQTINEHQEIGCGRLIVPWHDFSTREKLDAFIALANAAGPALAAAGIALGFHNHASEFLPNQDGQIPYDELCRRTEIGMELDIYWAYDAGRDPLALMDALGRRLMAVHLKDGLPGGEGKPLGQGTAPVKAVWEKAREKRIPIIVESETLTPDGLTEAKICMDYLRELEK